MKAFTPHLLPAATLLLHLALADWQFRSRPDLAPPRLNITIPATECVENGYLFIAPFAGLQDTPTEQHGPRQAGPYIFRDDGDLIWSGYGIYSIWAANFQAGRWKGKDILFSFEGDHNPGYGHGHGHITILDHSYETIRELRAGNHKISDKHEFHIVNEETGLIQIYQPVPRDLSKYGAKEDQQWIVNAIFQELNIATGEVLFEWASLDHVSPEESLLPINPGQAGSGYNSSDAWDYFHINSVDKDREGNYLISARDACSVHKINGTNGSLIWRLGGKKSDFRFTSDNANFCFQHHARWISTHGHEEVISLYDNAAHGTEHGGGHEIHTAPSSSGKILKLNTRKWTVELVQGYYPPPGHPNLLSKSQGSTQTFTTSGNVLVNWGSEGALTEYTADGTAIFHAYVESGELARGVENYRAFRYEWRGFPREDPVVIALVARDEERDGVRIYVSWNGDTETRVWRFFELAGGKRKFLGEVERKSFETAFFVASGKRGVRGRVVAEAVDSKGRVLRVSGRVAVEREVLPGGYGQTVLAEERLCREGGGFWGKYGIHKFFRARKDL